MSQPGVSACRLTLATICKNRLHHLERTLPHNLEQAGGYPGVEFLLLNYNSQDPLEDWAAANLGDHIRSGRLNYYREATAVHYSHSHAKNMSHRLAAGSLICNLDADAFLDRDSLEQIFELADRIPAGLLVRPRERLAGTICLYKRDLFDVLGGYNESFRGWGYDDKDLCHRAAQAGFAIFPVLAFRGISHGDELRTACLLDQDLQASRAANLAISENTESFKVNPGRSPGAGTVTRNFGERLRLA